MSRTLILVVVFTATAAAAFARDIQDVQVPIPPTPALATPASPMPAPVPPIPAAAQQPTPKPAPPVVAVAPTVPHEAARKIRGRDLNVQVEVTISDQIGSAAPEKKVVSLLAADQTMGRVRANAHARRGDLGMVGTGLNVDARPVVIDNDRILLELTLEYMPLRETQVTQQPTNLNESISVILQNGKPLMISQAADPISDRKMTVEVRATIVK